jgi:tRNA-2-methylthio-N6-dimethylallyladenosine synthase
VKVNVYAEKIRSVNKIKPLQVYVRTYGCQQNFADSEKIRGILSETGCVIVDKPDNADVVLLNTCAVRENAEERVFGNVGILKHLKKNNPNMAVILCGCMVQQEHKAKLFKEKFPFIDLIFGTGKIHLLPEMLCGVLFNTDIAVTETSGYRDIPEHIPSVRENKRKANIPIMYGCNNFCSYCVVPYVRGRERSRKSENVINETKTAINEGAKEILLLGQNVNSYNNGNDDCNFSELLRRLDKLDGDFIINFMTSHPKDCTTELIDTIAESRHISYHLHLPVQSGSDRILKLMNRHYTREKYLGIVRYAKEKIPVVSLTTDIITGFPGETYEDFKETLSLMSEVKFDSAFTFIFSKREGTKAFDMEDNVSYGEKNKWFQELLSLQREIGTSAYQKYVGKTLRVLCTGTGRTNDKLMTGKSRNEIIVDFSGTSDLIGKFADVKIIKALNWALVGELV